MIKTPVTFAFNYSHCDEILRQYIMHAFAESGAKHLVLTNDLMEMILKDANLAAKVRAEAASEGLTFMDSHAQYGGFYDLHTVDDATRRHAIHLHQLQIAIAAEMGIHTITIHPGADTLNPEIPLEKQTENVIRALDIVLPVAESFGVTVCIENSWSRLSRPNNLVYIKSKFPTDALGFCYDAGHANVLSSNAKQYEECAARERWSMFGLEPEWEDHALEKMLPHIVNCHLHDNDGQYDTHINVGDGNTDWEKVIKLLRKAPRLKCIQSEVTPLDKRIPIRKLCDAFRRLGEIE